MVFGGWCSEEMLPVPLAVIVPMSAARSLLRQARFWPARIAQRGASGALPTATMRRRSRSFAAPQGTSYSMASLTRALVDRNIASAPNFRARPRGSSRPFRRGVDRQAQDTRLDVAQMLDANARHVLETE